MRSEAGKVLVWGQNLELITNFGTGHKAAIASVLENADCVAVAVAFLKRTGAAALAEMLSPVLGRGGEAAVFIGTDFFLTEPDALETLRKLSICFPSLLARVGEVPAVLSTPKCTSASTMTELVVLRALPT